MLLALALLLNKIPCLTKVDNLASKFFISLTHESQTENMGRESSSLHIFFFPFLSHGHMIPMVDMAKLFASRGVKSTIVTTPVNASLISKAIGKSKTHNNNNIHIETIEFPCSKAGLPEGCENGDLIPSPDKFPVFFIATRLLQEPFEKLLLQHKPDCVIADVFFPWATDSASMVGIPRLVFNGTGFFSMCALECMRLYEPQKNVSSDSEPFVIPNLPGEIKMLRTQLPPASITGETNPLTEFFKEANESEGKCYGVVVNSFYELESVYADYSRNGLGRKAWHIGPLSLCNKDTEEKSQRGKDASIDENECLKWLDTKKPNSVVYICFGSIANFEDSQLREIALGLEASGQDFIWVVKNNKKEGEAKEEWLLEGFEKRMEGTGLIIRGWAPQVLILGHQAIGAFVTHCGWNSTLEGVAAGVPMVTWPMGAEQFYNEKLVTEVLKIGVPVGVKKWARMVKVSVEWEAIEKAVKKIMVGEEAEEMRMKANVLSQLANAAVENGGSSYSDLGALIHELVSLRH
ncbi:scopoletin glucosyltransferase [Arachis hypogaea]|uniref:scopoletin glucosyltransferase n=2 Tax=Arachis TaxID=3817 RepID=UPI0007AF5311|nr:scopoletin glucosyltransferase [Arachis hypogaea]QHN82302.1 Scopoletin glucosyltransferase [Arachis hypogaea]